MFVRWECGCVGLAAEDASQAIILQACDEGADRWRESLSWFMRDQTGKGCAALPAAKANELHAQIARRLHMADRWQDARAALGIPDHE